MNGPYPVLSMKYIDCIRQTQRWSNWNGEGTGVVRGTLEVHKGRRSERNKTRAKNRAGQRAGQRAGDRAGDTAEQKQGINPRANRGDNKGQQRREQTIHILTNKTNYEVRLT